MTLLPAEMLQHTFPVTLSENSWKPTGAESVVKDKWFLCDLNDMPNERDKAGCYTWE